VEDGAHVDIQVEFLPLRNGLKVQVEEINQGKLPIRTGFGVEHVIMKEGFHDVQQNIHSMVRIRGFCVWLNTHREELLSRNVTWLDL
jgi:hypothetical protein